MFGSINCSTGREVLAPNIFFLHSNGRWFLLDHLIVSLVLSCLFTEVQKLNVEAGADPDKAAAVGSSICCSSPAISSFTTTTDGSSSINWVLHWRCLAGSTTYFKDKVRYRQGQARQHQ